MKPLSRPLLADQNISREVIRLLREQGKDIRSLRDEDLMGANDSVILRRACEQKRVVLTHDSDFGTLAIHREEPYVGIIYLRPGHIATEFVMTTLATVDETVLTVQTPFIIVADCRNDSVRIRVRTKALSD
jgi:predicted nuclease of predicted toxin-antitoxin system